MYPASFSLPTTTVCVIICVVLQNLIRAVEVSKVDVRDSSRSALNEAALRAELAIVATKKNEALGVAEEYKRKASLLEQELGQVKMKLLRATQERVKMERDQRAALSLAKSMNQCHSGSATLSTSGADMEYYKRKVAELNGRLQGMTGVLAEKERHNEDLRAQKERSRAHRLAELRASKTTAGGRKRPL
jgi:predicted ribosome quality control (RQC) complex YloA/Tae2 family protein